ncbi:uncharacterized protein LOC136767916 [Amia ocellicauda]|uniref:uncharacterized protein LOC136767916 n=1 Tax=Amia ocellicauda TaxID=2972642 RepID=UPI003463C494
MEAGSSGETPAKQEAERTTVEDVRVDSKKSKGDFLWTSEATWTLVRVRLALDSSFRQPVCRKARLWERVAEAVRAGGHREVKGHECDCKWRNLLATYRKNRERARRLGGQAVHWEFFTAMDAVLGRGGDDGGAGEGATAAAATHPSPGSPKKKSPHSATATAPAVATAAARPQPGSSPGPRVGVAASEVGPQGTKVKRRSPPCSSSPSPSPDGLQLYLELQERRLAQWEEQRDLEERKIQAINNLAQAIASLAQKD